MLSFQLFNPSIRLNSGKQLTLVGEGPPVVFSSGLFNTMPRSLYNNFIDNLKKNVTIVSINDFSPLSKNDIYDIASSLNVDSVSSLDDLIKYIEENKMKTKLLIDVSQENKNLSGYLNYLEKITLNKNCSNLLTIPASSNKNMINSMMNFYKNAFPAIALTKLDESHISAEELSIFAELNCKIGILSGSRSIIGSIAFAKSQVLAQYMKDISI